jgi:DNA-binding NarL/FixJ family response regulator
MECGSPKRVLVVSSDARVSGALTAVLSGLPALPAQTRAATPARAYEIATAWEPDVAVVDVNRATATRDLGVLRRLGRTIPVVAICDCQDLVGRAAACGVVCCCEKNGDVGALTDAVTSAAARSIEHEKPLPRPVQVRAGSSAR